MSDKKSKNRRGKSPSARSERKALDIDDIPVRTKVQKPPSSSHAKSSSSASSSLGSEHSKTSAKTSRWWQDDKSSPEKLPDPVKTGKIKTRRESSDFRLEEYQNPAKIIGDSPAYREEISGRKFPAPNSRSASQKPPSVLRDLLSLLPDDFGLTEDDIMEESRKIGQLRKKSPSYQKAYDEVVNSIEETVISGRSEDELDNALSRLDDLSKSIPESYHRGTKAPSNVQEVMQNFFRENEDELEKTGLTLEYVTQVAGDLERMSLEDRSLAESVMKATNMLDNWRGGDIQSDPEFGSILDEVSKRIGNFENTGSISEPRVRKFEERDRSGSVIFRGEIFETPMMPGQLIGVFKIPEVSSAQDDNGSIKVLAISGKNPGSVNEIIYVLECSKFQTNPIDVRTIPVEVKGNARAILRGGGAFFVSGATPWDYDSKIISMLTPWQIRSFRGIVDKLDAFIRSRLTPV